MAGTDPSPARAPLGARFADYRQRCLAIQQDLLSRAAPGSLDEQGLPAYAQGNGPSRWLFWQRIRFCHRYLNRLGSSTEEKSDACLDFGCGSGLMLPRLAELFHTVYAVDLVIDPARYFVDAWSRQSPGGVDLSGLQLSDNLDKAGIAGNSLDLVLALDVLEHVTDLPATLSALKNLMKPKGVLLVSGPTESLLYRMGRKLVGFSGHYHVRNIYDIQKEMRKFFRVRILKRLYFPAPLFVILQATKE